MLNTSLTHTHTLFHTHTHTHWWAHALKSAVGRLSLSLTKTGSTQWSCDSCSHCSLLARGGFPNVCVCVCMRMSICVHVKAGRHFKPARGNPSFPSMLIFALVLPVVCMLVCNDRPPLQHLKLNVKTLLYFWSILSSVFFNLDARFVFCKPSVHGTKGLKEIRGTLLKTPDVPQKGQYFKTTTWVD